MSRNKKPPQMVRTSEVVKEKEEQMKYLHGHYTTQTRKMQGDFRRWKHRVKIAQIVL